MPKLFLFFTVAYLVIIQTEAASLEAAIVLKTTDAVDVQALKQITGVTAVYRLAQSAEFFWSPDGRGKEMEHKWNYAVIGNGFKDTEAQDAFLSEVSGMSFVELYAGYRSSVPKGFSADELNDMMKKADPKHFVKRPMEKATPAPDCVKFDLKKGERLVELSITRFGDQKALEKFSIDLHSHVFPALGVTYKSLGSVDSSDAWDQFAVMDWVDAATFCEYMQSQWAKDGGKKYYSAFKANAAAFGVEV